MELCRLPIREATLASCGDHASFPSTPRFGHDRQPIADAKDDMDSDACYTRDTIGFSTPVICTHCKLMDIIISDLRSRCALLESEVIMLRQQAVELEQPKQQEAGSNVWAHGIHPPEEELSCATQDAEHCVVQQRAEINKLCREIAAVKLGGGAHKFDVNAAMANATTVAMEASAPKFSSTGHKKVDSETRSVVVASPPIPDKPKGHYVCSEQVVGVEPEICEEHGDDGRHEDAIIWACKPLHENAGAPQDVKCLCSAGHLMRLLSFASTRKSLLWTCAGCKMGICELSAGTRCYQCAQCKYNLCESCFLQQGYPKVPCASCTQGHVLQILPIVSEESPPWICDGCEKHSGSLNGVVRCRCAQCDYDLCETCYLNWPNSLTSVARGVVKLPSSSIPQTPLPMKTQQTSCTPALTAACQLVNPTLQKDGLLDLQTGVHASQHGQQSNQEQSKLHGKCSTSMDDCSHKRTSMSSWNNSEDCLSTQTNVPHADNYSPTFTASLGSPHYAQNCHKTDVPYSQKFSKPIGHIRKSLAQAESGGSTPMAMTSTGAGNSNGINSSQDSLRLPDTHESFVFLHNVLAMPLMKRTEDLGKAYQYLAEASKLHVRIHGVASVEALYNMACCFSLGALAPDQSMRTSDMAPGLPPQHMSMPPEEVAAIRLDHAAAMLEASVHAGHANVTSMTADPDLENLRLMRPRQFAATVQKALFHPLNKILIQS